MKEQIKEGKKVTAGKLFVAGTCRLGMTVFDVVREGQEKHASETGEKQNKANEAYREKVEKAEAVKALGKPIESLTIAELKILLAPLKRKEDGAMPTKKEVLIQKLREWSGRDLIPVEEVAAPMPRFGMMEVDDEDGSENEGNMDDVLQIMNEDV